MSRDLFRSIHQLIYWPTQHLIGQYFRIDQYNKGFTSSLDFTSNQGSTETLVILVNSVRFSSSSSDKRLLLVLIISKTLTLKTIQVNQDLRLVPFSKTTAFLRTRLAREAGVGVIAGPDGLDISLDSLRAIAPSTSRAKASSKSSW
jgi:hypothetical protein